MLGILDLPIVLLAHSDERSLVQGNLASFALEATNEKLV